MSRNICDFSSDNLFMESVYVYVCFPSVYLWNGPLCHILTQWVHRMAGVSNLVQFGRVISWHTVSQCGMLAVGLLTEKLCRE